MHFALQSAGQLLDWHENAPDGLSGAFQVLWRRPILPEGCPSSIVGAGGFHYRVRDVNGWGTAAMTTRNRHLLKSVRAAPKGRAV